MEPDNLQKTPADLIGKLRLAGKIGIVTLGDGREIEIDKADLFNALNGDMVAILIKQETPLPKGQVTSVTKRARERFVGTVLLAEDNLIIKPDDRKIHRQFKFAGPEDKALVGEKILLEITDWGNATEAPSGKIIKKLGKAGLHNTEMNAIIIDRGFEADFPPAIEAEAEKLAAQFKTDLEKEIATRKDFRETTTFTIDPLDAKDFDDALSIKKLADDRYEIGIHIADVSHYVRPQTALDDEASKRGTSIYLVDRTIPMLPEVLSNDICSLKPNQDRLAFSAVFELNTNGEILAEWYGKTIIHSDRRFTYEEAQAVLNGELNEYVEELKTLNQMAYKLRAEKITQGAITFEDEEIKFVLDENGAPIEVIKKIRTDSHKLVEDFMLLANRKVAEYVSRLNKHQNHRFVFRIHDLPDLEKMKELKNFLKPFGLELEIADNGVSSKSLNKLLGEASKTTYGSMVHRAAVRAMAKAVYSTENIGHWGLAFKYYTHFTSPIRRYPDLLVHRLLHDYLTGKKPDNNTLSKVAFQITHSTDMEIKASEAERESIKLKQVEYMSLKIGQTFSGTISGVSKWGLFVEETETKADGMIHISKLGNDYFSLDEKNYRIVGQRTGAAFRLGDKITFKLLGADTERKMLDYELVK